ncbi:MAG: hypothetical protein ACFBSC_11075 [Microcoleaceae cyanobacterium]
MKYILILEDSDSNQFVLKPNGKYVLIDAFDEALIMNKQVAEARLRSEINNPRLARFSLKLYPSSQIQIPGFSLGNIMQGLWLPMKTIRRFYRSFGKEVL